MTRRSYSGNAASTTLAAAVGAGDLSMRLTDPSGWPTGLSGPFYVSINRDQGVEEKILCASRTGDTLTVTTRGADGTSPQAHSKGAPCAHVWTAVDADEANAHVNASADVHGVAGDLSGFVTGSADAAVAAHVGAADPHSGYLKLTGGQTVTGPVTFTAEVTMPPPSGASSGATVDYVDKHPWTFAATAKLLPDGYDLNALLATGLYTAPYATNGPPDPVPGWHVTVEQQSPTRVFQRAVEANSFATPTFHDNPRMWGRHCTTNGWGPWRLMAGAHRVLLAPFSTTLGTSAAAVQWVRSGGPANIENNPVDGALWVSSAPTILQVPYTGMYRVEFALGVTALQQATSVVPVTVAVNGTTAYRAPTIYAAGDTVSGVDRVTHFGVSMRLNAGSQVTVLASRANSTSGSILTDPTFSWLSWEEQAGRD